MSAVPENQNLSTPSSTLAASPGTRASLSSDGTGLPFKIKPWGHQLEAIRRASRKDCFALLFEMGAGKTSTAINILRWKYTVAGRLLPTLVLCPPIVIDNWKAEFLAHSNLPGHRIHLVGGTAKERARTISNVTAAGRGGILVTNYESLLMPEVYEALKKFAPDCLVVDESHRCKTPGSKRAKAVTRIADKARVCRLILSGTPILNSPMDIYTQFRIMDGGKSFGTNFQVFKHRYFWDTKSQVPGNKHVHDWQPRAGALLELNALIAENGLRVEKKDCMDLPPFVRQTVYVELSAQQRKHYKEMRRDFVTFLDDKACTAELAVTKALRLQQIVSGYIAVTDKEGEKTHVSIQENPRAVALYELLAELGTQHKVLVWSVFKQNYETIRDVCEALKLDFVEVHGEISDDGKKTAVKRFENDPAVRVLIGHPGSGGIGVNLVAASYSIFYSRSFSLEHDLQAEARNYRGGSERHEKVTRIDLVAKGTIDEVVLKSLANKQEVSDTMLRNEIQSEAL